MGTEKPYNYGNFVVKTEDIGINALSIPWIIVPRSTQKKLTFS